LGSGPPRKYFRRRWLRHLLFFVARILDCRGDARILARCRLARRRIHLGLTWRPFAFRLTPHPYGLGPPIRARIDLEGDLSPDL